jgi:hypothetical protein
MAGHQLAITLPGERDGIEAETGEATRAPSEFTAEAAAWLPHSCEEWVIGSGTPARVITELQELRAEIDAAITRLQASP